MPHNPPQQGLSFGPQGSTATPVYWELQMNIYPVSEDRLDNISAFSRGAAICFSFGSLFIPKAFEVIQQKHIAESISDPSVLVAIVCYILGITFWRLRGGTIKKLKDNCKKITVGPAP